MKAKFFKITRPDLGRHGYVGRVEELISTLEAELNEHFVGEQVQIEFIDMTDEQYDNITEEFTGW